MTKSSKSKIHPSTRIQRLAKVQNPKVQNPNMSQAALYPETDEELGTMVNPLAMMKKFEDEEKTDFTVVRDMLPKLSDILSFKPEAPVSSDSSVSPVSSEPRREQIVLDDESMKVHQSVDDNPDFRFRVVTTLVIFTLLLLIMLWYLIILLN